MCEWGARKMVDGESCVPGYCERFIPAYLNLVHAQVMQK